MAEITESIQKKARGYADTLIDNRDEIAVARVANAFGRIRKRVIQLLISNLTRAIEQTAEYNIEPLKSTLIGVFQDENIIKVSEDGDIYSLAYDIAGDENDFFDGIEYAREVLGLGKLDKESAAKFWKIFIYQPYREGTRKGSSNKSKKLRGMTSSEYAAWAYTRTIEARIDGWHGKAPFWIILENGNGGSSLAYPNFQGTYFLQKTLTEAQALLSNELSVIDREIETIVNSEVSEFLNNPETFTPGTRFGTFIVEGKKYYIYVTKTRRLGVAQRPRV